MPTVLIPLAEGFEELEAVSIIDILRRAEIDVVVAGLAPGPIAGSRGVRITPDAGLDAALHDEYDMIAMPGGLPGATNLEADERVVECVRAMAAAGKWTCAVCAGPIVLRKAGVLAGKTVTSYPGFLDRAENPDFTYTGAAVETDGRVITSRGPGTAMDFALELVRALLGKDARGRVEQGLVRPEHHTASAAL